MNKIILLLALVCFLGCRGPSQESAATVSGSVESIGGLPIAYTAQGRGDTAVVLLHGWCCDQSYWSKQVEALQDGYRVVTLDLGGHGKSGMEREGWPLMAYGADVAAVLDQLGLRRVVLVGHSMGGSVALETARLRPESVIGVVGVDSLHDVEFQFNAAEMRAFVAALEMDFDRACREFVRSMFLADADPDLVDRVATNMCYGPPEVGVALMRQIPDYDMGAALRAVQVPVRCINASSFPTNVEANRKHAANYEVVLMDGVGHFPMLERPEEFNRLLVAAIEEIDAV